VSRCVCTFLDGTCLLPAAFWASKRCLVIIRVYLVSLEELKPSGAFPGFARAVKRQTRFHTPWLQALNSNDNLGKIGIQC
jgi:hypothetical protein